jgi:hypothetical protein
MTDFQQFYSQEIVNLHNEGVLIYLKNEYLDRDDLVKKIQYYIKKENYNELLNIL